MSMFFCLYKGVGAFETHLFTKNILTAFGFYIIISGYYDKQYLIHRKYCRFTAFCYSFNGSWNCFAKKAVCL